MNHAVGQRLVARQTYRKKGYPSGCLVRAMSPLGGMIIKRASKQQLAARAAGHPVPRLGVNMSIIYAGLFKSKHMTLGHFATQPFRSVILSTRWRWAPFARQRTDLFMSSAAKNLTARPFASLRVTDLLCQSFVVRFSLAKQAKNLLSFHIPSSLWQRLRG